MIALKGKRRAVKQKTAGCRRHEPITKGQLRDNRAEIGKMINKRGQSVQLLEGG